MIIKITPNDNGSHINQCFTPDEIPVDFAIVPDDMTIPETFPFVDIEVENGIVTKMTADHEAYNLAKSSESEVDDTSTAEIVNTLLGV